MLPRRPVLADVQIVISANYPDLSGLPLFEEAHFAGVRAAALALGRAQLL